MKSHQAYLSNLIDLLTILRQDCQQVEDAAGLIAQSLQNDGLIHVFGTGHSHMLAEEMFYRAGGLGSVNPILEEDLMLHKNASRSTELERNPGLAINILAKHELGKGDIFIIASNSGGNALVEAIGNQVKQLGLKLIAITSLKHATSPAARAQGRKIHELADITIDNLGQVGDATIAYPGLEEKTGPTSTVLGTAIVNALVVRSVEIMIENGHKPEIFSSSNTLDGDSRNSELLSILKERVSIL